MNTIIKRLFFALSLFFYTFFLSAKTNSSKIKIFYYHGKTFWGHIAFQIESEHFRQYYSYPSENMESQDLSFYGYQKKTVILPINQDKINRFLDWYNHSIYSQTEKNHIHNYLAHYHPSKFNCAHFVKYALRALGYNVHSYISLAPTTPFRIFKRSQKIAEKIKEGKMNWEHSQYKIHYVQKKTYTLERAKEIINGKANLMVFLKFLYPNLYENKYFY